MTPLRLDDQPEQAGLEGAQKSALRFCDLARAAGKVQAPDNAWERLAERVLAGEWDRALKDNAASEMVFQTLEKELGQPFLARKAEAFLLAAEQSPAWMAALLRRLTSVEAQRGRPGKIRLFEPWIGAQLKALEAAPEKNRRKAIVQAALDHARFWDADTSTLRRLARSGVAFSQEEREAIFSQWAPKMEWATDGVDEQDPTLDGGKITFFALAQTRLIDPASAREWLNEQAQDSDPEAAGCSGWAAAWSIAAWHADLSQCPPSEQPSGNEWALWRGFVEHAPRPSQAAWQRARQAIVRGDERAQLSDAARRKQGERERPEEETGAEGARDIASGEGKPPSQGASPRRL